MFLGAYQTSYGLRVASYSVPLLSKQAFQKFKTNYQKAQFHLHSYLS